MHVLGGRGKAGDAAGRMEAARRLGDAQVLDARRVIGREHLLVSCERADRAMREGTNVARSLAMEFLLYASGERQISEAIAKMGIREDTAEFAVALFGGEPEPLLEALGLTRDDDVLAGTPDKLRAFGLTAAELSTVPADRQPDLVFERVALVDLLK